MTKAENKTQHIHILMAPSEAEAIDDWGFKNRIRTKGEAIRRLCQMGMNLDERSDALQEAALAGGEAYQEFIAKLDKTFKREDLSAEDKAKAVALLVPMILNPLQILVMRSLEVTELTQPYRSGADLDEAAELANEFLTAIKEASSEEISSDDFLPLKNILNVTEKKP